MFRLLADKQFDKSAGLLPLSARKKLADLLDVIRLDPFDSRAHTKPLEGQLKGIYSFRISRDWRVLFVFDDIETIRLIVVKHRKDIYR